VSSLYVHLLGRFEISDGSGAPVGPLRRQAQAVLAVLALSPGMALPRDKLIALLWSERSEDQARNSLRHVLSDLRKAFAGFNPPPLIADREMARIDSNAVEVDAVTLQCLINDGTPESLQRAAKLYQGDLLDGIAAHSPAFEEWLRFERTRLYECARSTLSRLLDHQMAAQQADNATDTAQRLLSLDTAHEGAHRALMRIYTDRGDRALALKQCQTCCEALQAELGIEPEDTTRKILEEIRNDQKPVVGEQTELVKDGYEHEPSARHNRPSIAVLPFRNLGHGDQSDRLTDAFTETIITEFARSPVLRIIARNSVFTYKNRAVDLRELGANLNVRYALEGSLEILSKRIRVTAQLSLTTDGSQLWAKRFESPVGDFFVVRDNVVTEVVGILIGYDSPIWEDWRNMARHRPPNSLTAFDYVLLADTPYRKHDRNGIAEARALAEKAVQLDPDYAYAWDFIAQTHAQDAINGWTNDRRKSWNDFYQSTQRAAELDPADAEIQFSVGLMYFAQRKSELGKQAWNRAIKLRPNDAYINRVIGGLLPIALGTEQALAGIELVERSLYELDPLHPPWQWISLARPLYFAGRYDEAFSAISKIPDPWLEVHIMKALIRAQLGDQTGAADEIKMVGNLDPAFSAEYWVDNNIYQPGSSSAKLFVEGARKAGLRLCANLEEAEKLDAGNRLSECDGTRG